MPERVHVIAADRPSIHSKLINNSFLLRMSHDPVKVLLRYFCEVLTCLLSDATRIRLFQHCVFFPNKAVNLDDTFHIRLNSKPTKSTKESHGFLDAIKVALQSVNNKNS